jgi:hypothetical protein
MFLVSASVFLGPDQCLTRSLRVRLVSDIDSPGPLDVRHQLEDALGDPFVVVDPLVSIIQIFGLTWCSSCGSEILNYVLPEMYNFYTLSAVVIIKLDLGLLESARYTEDQLH